MRYVVRRGKVFLLLMLLLPPLLMAQDKKISELTSGNPAQSDDQIPIARSGINYRITAGSIASLVSSSDGSIIWTGSSGVVDNSVFSRYSSGTGAAPGTCSVGTFYLKTDSNLLYGCTSANTFTQMHSGTLGVGSGGTGLTGGTSGGVPTFTAAGTMTSSGALTANLPVIGGGAGAVVSVGTRSGNTTEYVTTTGAQTSGDCVKIDASGNHVANGSACGGGAFDPGTSFYMYEEFVGGAGSNQYYGTNGMSVQTTATGSAALQYGQFGYLRLSSHATNDNSGAEVYAERLYGTITGWGDWLYDVQMIMGSNSTAITSTGAFVGLAGSGVSTGASSCVWIRRDTDRTDSTFYFQVGNASGPTGCDSAASNTYTAVVASTITPSAGTQYRFRIRRAASGVGGNDTIYMRVNDETEKTFCSSGCDASSSTVPNASMFPFVEYLTRTTTGVMSGDVDYIYFTATKTRY